MNFTQAKNLKRKLLYKYRTFEFVKEYITIPGSITFEQSVKRWEMSRELFEKIRVSGYELILNSLSQSK